MNKLIVTLGCAGGVSTSILCAKIVAEGKKYDYEIECTAMSVLQIEDAIPQSDIVLLGPQVKYMLSDLRNKYPDKLIDVIDMRDYGSMNAENIMKKYLEK